MWFAGCHSFPGAWPTSAINAPLPPPLGPQNPPQRIIPGIRCKQIKADIFAILDQKRELAEIGYHLDHFCFTNTQHDMQR